MGKTIAEALKSVLYDFEAKDEILFEEVDLDPLIPTMPSASFQVKTNLKKSTKTFIDTSALTKESINAAKVKRAEQKGSNEKEELLRKSIELENLIKEKEKMVEELAKQKKELQLQLQTYRGRSSIRSNRPGTRSTAADREVRRWKELRDKAEAEYNNLRQELSSKGIIVRKSSNAVHAIPEPKQPR